MNRLIGIDPEIFLRDRSSFVSGIGKFGGSKDNPLPFGTIPGFALQEDNVALEFNTPPTDDCKTFVKYVNTALKELEQRAKAQGLTLSIVASAVFSDSELNNEHARRFGCDPDFNAWTLQENRRDDDVDPNLRSCGGHIHVGVDDWNMEHKINLVRAMDLYLGIPSIRLDNGIEGTRRRQLYGKAGAFRDKVYGVEYRTLSNFWLASNKLKAWAFNQSQEAVKFIEQDNRLTNEDGELIQAAINDGDQAALKTLEKRFPQCSKPV